MNAAIIVLMLALHAGAAPEDPAADAVRLARAGDHELALQRFRALVAANPADLDSRVWLGRLLDRTGRRGEAEAVLRGVVAEAPDSADALLALGSLLTTTGRLEDARVMLERANSVPPERADVLAALGRAYRLSGRPEEALACYRRAAALDSADGDAREGLETTRRHHDHSVHVTHLYEPRRGGQPDTQSGSARVELRMSDRIRIDLQGQLQQKFGAREFRSGGGVQWRARPTVTIRSGVSLAPGATMVPRAEGVAEIERHGARVDVTGGLRLAHFDTATVWVAAPAVSVPVGETVAFSAGYYLSLTSFDRLAGAVANHSGRVAVRTRVHRRVWANLGYSRGNESFETLTVERLGRFRADTVTVGARFDHHSLSSFAVSGDYQRSSAGRLFRLTAGITRYF